MHHLRLFPVLILAFASLADAKTYKLYYLGGQSNMDGYGHVRDLPDDLKPPMKEVPIFHGNTDADGKPVNGRGTWTALQPGHGVGFVFDGKNNKYSDRFGVELTFVRQLRKLDPDANIAIIKYSRGGTSIHASAAGNFGCWEPDYNAGTGLGKGINQYDHFLATLRHAFAARDIDGDGEDDTLIPSGIVWMQGESDAANTEEIAKQYEANLKRLMDLIRAALRVDDVPVIIGRISDSRRGGKLTWAHGEIVRQAQADYVTKDGTAALVTSTDNYGYSDPWHYDSKGYIDLGTQFADALHMLANPQASKAGTTDTSKP
ncbi:MAG: sialate O-acetylesterase [Phycisphaeraceae bacterium]